MAILKSLYNESADQYETLIQHEDYQHQLVPAINRLHPLQGAVVAEFGAGTGRVTRLLAPHVRAIRAFELSESMARVGVQALHQAKNALMGVADNRALPVRSASADLAVEGWSFAQMVAWQRDQWREVMDQTLAEMRRVVRSGGTMILIETLGTGSTEPNPPSDWMAELYATFENDYGFTRTAIRTDFFFDSAEQVQQILTFFFGEANVSRIIQEKLIPHERGVVVPECTGLWWRRVE